MIRTKSLLLAVLLIIPSVALAQDDDHVPNAFERQMSRVDFGISAAAIFNQTVSGIVAPKRGGTASNLGLPLSDSPSNTVGALVNIRYTDKPLVGFEFNFLYSKLTENFCCSVAQNSLTPGTSFPNLGLQTQANEFSIGYLIQPKINIIGLQPYASAGLGTTEFKPTAHGGLGSPKQARMNYYYSLGVQKDLLSNFGIRVGFRQTFLMAPDFGLNYLTIYQHTTVIEPNFGFYVRF